MEIAKLIQSRLSAARSWWSCWALSVLIAGSAGCGVGPEKTVAIASPPVRVSANLPLEQLRKLASTASAHSTELQFASVAALTGLEFTYQNGSQGHRLMTEATGGGCGWIDFDRDGMWDIYLGQGGVADADPAASQPSDQLFRNQGGRFVDVTAAAGIRETLYGQGVAVGDLDNDGFDDVFVTNVGGNTLWQNQGDGTFLELTEWSDTAWAGWSTSAAWADVDLDGDLDLYVCNYCDFSPRSPKICRNPDGKPIQCQPNWVAPVPDHYYENLGDGRFRECAFERGFHGDGNRALGVVVADLLGDARPEIFVANDATANFLFVEDQPGQFVDSAARYGCALDANGQAQANMGIAVGDYDRNGRLDLYVTHFEGEWNTLYANDGDIGFHDATAEADAVQCTLPWVGFGVAWQDFDQDGRDELFIANGHIDDLGRERVLSMPPQLLTFDGRRWHDLGSAAGAYFGGLYIGRAAAEADFDNDGDLDIAVVHQNAPVELLENRSRRGHWLACEFVGRQANRRGIGVRVTVRQGERSAIQELAAGVGYCSSRQPHLVFGLGDLAQPCDIDIRWPGGVHQRLRAIDVDQKLQIVEQLANADQTSD